LILDPILDQADAIVAAWLPGTEGEGITDVLFGDYKPVGKLSFTWPSQFKYGYGLTY
jgi:beta-glucosidase